jgi:peptidoglycan/LPS O-acetylase OafA/YrhL
MANNLRATGIRILPLDGWRGIALLTVVFDHLNGFNGNRFRIFDWTGGHGVTLFFVLSGFLITSLFIKEKEATGTIDVRAFYLRRFFRLWPAALSFLCFAFLTRLSNPVDIASILLFCRNFCVGSKYAPLQTGHFWSLSIEEQFYLFWPIILVSLGFRCARFFAVSASAILALWRFSVWYSGAMTMDHSYATQFRADALLIGCAFALLPKIDIPKKLHSALLLVSLTALPWAVHHFARWDCWGSTLLMGFAIWSTPKFKTMCSVLSFKPLTWIGRISYSIYLWQQPILIFQTRGVAAAIIKLSLALCAGCLSYYYIEQPMIAYGKRFATKSSESERELRIA